MRQLFVLVVAIVLCSPAWATNYFITTSGSDGANGLTIGTAWASPNHALNCGDVITASAGTYTPTNGFQNDWGTVTCAAGNNVAVLTCATFDACKFVSSNGLGMVVNKSYWGVFGWEVTATTAQAICFEAIPNGGTNIHHIIFANDVANGCYGAGFQNVENGISAGVDYFVVIGTIAYNASQQSSQCGSGISVTGPQNSDTLPGTHIFISQTFGWENVNPNPCGGTQPTDGEAVIVDTPDSPFPYTGQVVVSNSIGFLNGGRGFSALVATSGAPMYFYNLTSASNMTNNIKNTGFCAEIGMNESWTTEVYNNISRPSLSTSCGGNPDYAYVFDNANATAKVYNNTGYSAAGNNTRACQGTCTGFVSGPNNTYGTDPAFANLPASDPGAPNCSGKLNVIDCMSTIIADFVPTAPGFTGKGYQPPTTPAVQTYDPLYPQWLCDSSISTHLTGLVTQHCVTPGQYKATIPPVDLKASITFLRRHIGENHV